MVYFALSYYQFREGLIDQTWYYELARYINMLVLTGHAFMFLYNAVGYKLNPFDYQSVLISVTLMNMISIQ